MLAPLPKAQSDLELIFGRGDTGKEIEMGRQVYDQMKKSGLLSRNTAMVQRTERIFSQLVACLPQKLYPYQVVVVASSEINANCLPGGYVTVFEGLLTAMPEDDELAFVLAHEIGHAARRHTMSLFKKLQTDYVIAMVMGGQQGSSYLTGAFLSHSREHETEADRFGTELYLRAGFDAKVVSRAMQVLADEGDKRGQRVPEYQSTHPDPRRRVKEIEKTAATLLERGLKPISVTAPDLSIQAVFGKIPTLSSEAVSWFPLDAGMQWSYRVKRDGATSQYSVRVVGVSLVDGSSVARLETSLPSSKISSQWIADKDRVWRRGRLNSPDSPWAVELIIPRDNATEKLGTKEFQSLGYEDVETPAGKFANCLKMRVRGEGTPSVICWYASGTGLVKRVQEGTGTEELLVSLRRPN
ncbi:MAG: M48 family metalloprotease [Armatimonadetes bacterium]|nr:M48 family metalloprotease [Armatimonadota bacterium]